MQYRIYIIILYHKKMNNCKTNVAEKITEIQNKNTHMTLLTLPILQLYIGYIFCKKIAHITATYNISEH